MYIEGHMNYTDSAGPSLSLNVTFKRSENNAVFHKQLAGFLLLLLLRGHIGSLTGSNVTTSWRLLEGLDEKLQAFVMVYRGE